MSDFLNSLVARQLGDAASVRPRLAGRFEPSPDAFASEAPRRATEFEEPDANALELFPEVETRPEPARTPRRETDETSTRFVFVREQRGESQSTSSPERSPAQSSDQTHEAASSMDAADAHARARAREESDAPVRPKSIVPSFGEEAARASVESTSDARTTTGSGVDEREPVRPSSPARGPSSFATRERISDERREPSQLEPRATSRREAEDSRPSSSNVRPAPSPTSARIEVRDVRRASDEASSFTQTDSTRTRESAHSRDDANESGAERHARQFRQESAAFEPPQGRRVARQSKARDASRTQTEPTPTINVTIGRVEVRATHAPQASPRRTESAAPRMSLEDYLRRRNGEVRE
jgi:hypothetical protein